MNLYYLNHRVNELAKKCKSCSEQIQLAELLQDAEAAGYVVEYDKAQKKYTITGGRKNG